MKKTVSVFLALALVCSVFAAVGGHAGAAKALPEGVLYYWGFENDSDLTAVAQTERRSGAEGTAAVYDITPINRRPEIAQGVGVSGNALHLDGTYGVKLNDLEKIDLDAYTISVWVYSTKAVNNAPVVQLGSNMGGDPTLGDTTWMKFGFTPENSDNIMFSLVEMYDSAKGAVEFPGLLTAIGGQQEQGFIPGEWQMITLVVDGEKFTAEDGEEHVGTRFYVDGKLVEEANATKQGLEAALPGLLAGDCMEGFIGINYQEELFQGYVDELYIFDRALNDNAIQQLRASVTPQHIPFVPTPAATTPPATTPAATTPAATTPAVSAPVVTKNPTSETVTVGGNAYFVAHANNARTVNWYILSADRGTRIPVNNAPWNFSGVTVTGEGTDTLLLSNIPLTMNGWFVEAVYTGEGGSASTIPCALYVNQAPKAALYAVPSSGIYTDPKPVQLTAAPGDTIYYELIDENGYARTGTVQSGEYVTIPLVYDIVYVARLTAYVAGDQSNLIVCEYTMDGTTYAPDPAPQPDFAGGGFTNNEATVTLTPTGGDSFYANVNILRLCNMDGAGNYSNGTVTMFLTDPSGNPMGATYNVGSGTLSITYSTWELLPEGTSFYGVY